MEVYFVTDINDIEDEMSKVPNGSLLLIGHDANINIDLVAELEDKSDILRRLSVYSKRQNITLIAGIKARIYRRHYLSAVVIDRGHIMGISDATHEDANMHDIDLGASYRVYKTALGYIGVIVGIDACYPEVMRTLARHNADYIVELAGEIREYDAKTILSTLSYLGGIATFSIVGHCPIATNSKGNMLDITNGVCNADIIDIRRDDTLVQGIRNAIYDNVYIEE